MPIYTGPERVSNDATPKLSGDLDTNGHDIKSTVAGIAFVQDTITSSTTDDISFELITTLNDSGEAGGNDTFTLMKGDITGTNTTGWNNIFLMDLQVDGQHLFKLDLLSAKMTVGDYGTGGYTVAVRDQNPASNVAGAGLTLQGGAAGSATTGGAGGAIKIEAGAAGGSGDNAGGAIMLTPGAATGAGKDGGVLITDATGTPGTNSLFLAHSAGGVILANLQSSTFTFMDNTFSPVFSVNSTGVSYAGRLLDNQGADVASANDVTLGADGNTFEITGTTQINRIVNTNWTNGTKITLLFTSTPTVKHGQATATVNITILLAGAADFTASAGDVLTLMLCEIGGTQAWREVARTAI